MGAKFYEISDVWVKEDGKIMFVITPTGKGDLVLYTISSEEFTKKEAEKQMERKSGISKGL